MFTKFSMSQRDKLVAVTLFVLVLILGYGRMVPEVCGNFHDDGIYVITAKALAQGQGYRLTYLPHAPLQTKYPILYPALLAAVWKLWPSFPENLLLMKWLSLLCGAATISLSYLYFLRFGYFSRSIAAASGLVCATSPIFLYFSTQTLSEIPFSFLVILSLWSFDAQMEQPDRKGIRQIFLGVLLALPFLCRSIGVTLVVAALLIQYYRGRTIRWMALGMAVVMLPWFIWMAAGMGNWNRDPITGYYTDYVSWWTTMDVALAFRIIWHNLVNILISSTTVMLEGFSKLLHSLHWAVQLFLTILIGSIPVIALITNLRTWRLLPFFIAAYFLLVLVWPWHPMRFLVPLLPFLVGYFFQGLSDSIGRWKIKKSYLLAVGLSFLVATNLILLYQYKQEVEKFHYPYPFLPDKPASWVSYKNIFHWLQTHSQPDDVIASMEDPMIFLYTDRRAIRPFKITPGIIGYGDDLSSYGSPEDLLKTMKAYKVRYLVQFPIFAFDRDRINGVISEIQKRDSGSLKRVYTRPG